MEYAMFSLGVRARFREGINTQLTCLMNFCFLWPILEKRACPTHPLTSSLIFLSTDNFFQILLVGVALGKAPVLT